MSLSGPAISAASPVAPDPETGAASLWAWAALAVAFGTLAGSLSLSLGLGLKACPLCFYQRTFAMGLVAVLGMGLVAGVGRAQRLSLLALPLATAGLGVALFHVSLELRDKLECPRGVFGLGTAPQQSLPVYAVLFALLLVDALRAPKADAGPWIALAAAVALGALLTVSSCIANPPPPPAPTEPYPKPPDVCRPPFRPQ
jgi:disulfide bond formation protein DsbB